MNLATGQTRVGPGQNYYMVQQPHAWAPKGNEIRIDQGPHVLNPNLRTWTLPFAPTFQSNQWVGSQLTQETDML